MNNKGLIKASFLTYFAYKTYQLARKAKIKRQQIKKRRRTWVKEVNITRDLDGYFAQKFYYMKKNEPDEFFYYTRMQEETFDLVMLMLSKEIKKTSIRKPIDPECRLFLTLMFLAQGISVQTLAEHFKLGVSTVRSIIYEICDAIWNTLWNPYICQPTIEEWKRYAEEYENLLNLPNCISAIAGKHINVWFPPKSIHDKGCHSFILLAAANANYSFTAMDIGTYRISGNGGDFPDGGFGKKLLTDNLELPEENFLSNSDIKFPYYFIGDITFPLRTRIMRPHPGQNLDDIEKINFNKRLSDGQRIIENTFGILAARWNILSTILTMTAKNAEKIIKATVVLHNFIKLHDTTYAPSDFVDHFIDNVFVEGKWRKETRPLNNCYSLSSNNSSKYASRLREKLTEYFHIN